MTWDFKTAIHLFSLSVPTWILTSFIIFMKTMLMTEFRRKPILRPLTTTVINMVFVGISSVNVT